MSIETFLINYGHLAVFLGTFLEGETVLIIGGFLARRGYLSLILVIVAAFVATILWDFLFFYLGRAYGEKVLNLKKSWKPGVKKILKRIENNSRKVILTYRFVYGTKTIVPFALGMSDISIEKYTKYNLAYTLIWSATFGVLGYFFGYGLELFLGKLRGHELKIIFLVAIVFAMIWPVYRHFIKKSGKMGITKDI